MLRNYLTVALRTLRRRPGYTAINVGGLAVGLAACLLIGLWVERQLSYDKHFARSERLFRLVADQKTSEGTSRAAVAPPAWAAGLQEITPAVQEFVRVQPQTETFAIGGQPFSAEVFWADSTFLDVFGLDLLRGDPSSVLRPGSVVLSERAARKYFGDENPLGQTLRINATDIDETAALTVTGVMKDMPPATHFRAEIIAPFPPSWRSDLDSFWTFLPSAYSYVLLSKEADPSRVQKQMQALIERRLGEDAKQFEAYLQPVTSIHLRSDRLREIRPGGDIRYVWLFSAIAVLVLLIAVVNYVNLATARAAQRAGEVGMRRALGAERWQVAGQFLGEAVLVSGAAAALALLLAGAGRFFLEDVTRSEFLGEALLGSVGIEGLLILAAATLGVALLAGAYPALYLSSLQPAHVLRSRGSVGSGSSGSLRRTLVVGQFALVSAVLIATAVVWGQLRHMQSENLGFEKERVLILPIKGQMMIENGRAFEQALLRQPGVRSVAAISEVPGKRLDLLSYRWAGSAQSVTASAMGIGPSLDETLELKLAAGRWFEQGRASDSTSFVLNETAARRFGWSPAEAIGKRIRHEGNAGEILSEGTVIGVGEDFHFASLREEIGPLVLTHRTDPYVRYWETVVQIEAGQVAAALAQVRSVWERFAPGHPYRYSFLDEEWAALYRAERRFGRLFGIGAALAIFVACLGLFGLAAFAVEERTKEIGIRKALGASAGSIVALLSKDFLLLVLAGFAVATPVAWWAMRQWLDGFAYRIELGPLVFVAAGGVALLVAALTVSTQALRAARSNPADALRDE